MNSPLRASAKAMFRREAPLAFLSAPLAALIVVWTLVSCAGADSTTGTGSETGDGTVGAPSEVSSGQAATPAQALEQAPIVLDGGIDDWPQDASVLADGTHLYFRVKIVGEAETIQAMRRPLLARFDLDGDSATGARYVTPPEASAFGVDFEIVFSPRSEREDRGFGVAASAVNDDGSLRPIPAAALDLQFAPSYASEWYEGRLALAALLEAGLPRPPADAPARQVFVLGDGAGSVAGWAPAAAFHWPEQVLPAQLVDLESLAKAPGDVRVMTWNVARDGPQRDPAAFARVILAAAPDIILLQEWDDGGPREIHEWLAAHVADDSDWSVVTSAGRGVAVAARTPLAPLTRARLQPEELEHPVRFASALVATEAGPIAVGSVHLRCCGYAGSAEDRARRAEAAAINEAMAEALDGIDAAAVVIGGDLNLVGTWPPIAMLAERLDVDGSELEIADARAPGGRTLATWSSAGSVFTPTRLDYVLHSGASTSVSRGLVLDTRALTDQSLERLGLLRDDTHASDHRPVIVDLSVTPAQ